MTIPREQLERLAAAWETAESMPDAFKSADWKLKDRRHMCRMRRHVEKELGVILPSHNPQNGAKTHAPYSTRRLDFKRMVTVVSFSDCHWWPHQEKTDAHKILLKVIKDIKPHAVGCRGDLMDGARLSRFPNLPNIDQPSTADEVVTAVNFINEITAAAKKARPSVDLEINVGNHERIEIKMANMQPQENEVLQGLLAGLGALDKTPMEILFPAWHVSSSTLINNTFLWKHKPHRGGVNGARNSALNAGVSTGNGHTHRLGVTALTDFNGTRFGVECGTLADPMGVQFEYCEDSVRDWQPGFVVQYFNGERVENVAVNVIDGKAIFNGKTYRA